MTIEIPETIGTPFGPSVEGASPALLSHLLGALEGELRKQGVPVDEYLRPGASASAVYAGFDKCGLVPPDEAVVWFGWRDGTTDHPDSEDVMPMFLEWSLAECVAAYLDPAGQPKGHEDWQWDPAWIQIMGDANGLAISCAAPADQAPLVRALSWTRELGTQPNQTLNQAVSLCTPVAWWVDALQQGWYRWNSDAHAWDAPNPFGQPRIRALRGLS
jgi:hypothetical protein